MIDAERPSLPPASTRRAAAIHRDILVGRYDHVPQGAPWLRAIAVEAALVAEVPTAAINLMKSTTQRTVAAVGIETTIHSRKDSMCGTIIDAGRTVHVPDASADDRWASNPFVNGRWGHIRFYGAHPLIGPSGLAAGTLCVFDARPRELEPGQVAELDALASRAVRELERSRLAALTAGIRGWSQTMTVADAARSGPGGSRVP